MQLTTILTCINILLMYVCLCKGITDSDLQRCVDAGARDFTDVQSQLGVSTQCGSCECLASDIVQSRLAERDRASLFYPADLAVA